MVEHGTVTIRDVELTYDLAGTGPDLVWGHGLTSSMAAEDELGLFDFPTLRDRHRVLRYDARGHGASGSTPDHTASSWRELALDQLALADALGIDRYVAGGASMGCAAALHAAVEASDRIRGLLLVIPPTAWASRAAQVEVYDVMADLAARRDHDTLIAGAAATPSPDPFVDEPRWKARFPELLATVDPERVARMFRGAGTADLPSPDDLAALADRLIPTLILAWTGDPGHPVVTAARLQELMPHAHLALATTPDGLASWTGRAAAFLDRCDPS